MLKKHLLARHLKSCPNADNAKALALFDRKLVTCGAAPDVKVRRVPAR